MIINTPYPYTILKVKESSKRKLQWSFLNWKRCTSFWINFMQDFKGLEKWDIWHHKEFQITYNLNAWTKRIPLPCFSFKKFSPPVPIPTSWDSKREGTISTLTLEQYSLAVQGYTLISVCGRTFTPFPSFKMHNLSHLRL